LILGDLNDAVSFMELTYCEMGLDYHEYCACCLNKSGGTPKKSEVKYQKKREEKNKYLIIFV
jgi:hypothetical protein